MIYFFLIIIAFGLFAFFKPDKAFWWAVIIFIDPGGYIQEYVERSYIGGFQITDLTILLLLLPLISPFVSIKPFFLNKDAKRLFYFLLGFTLIYHILIFGYIAPGYSIIHLTDLLQYERLTLWGWVVIVPAYIFFLRNQKYFLKMILITSLITMGLYLLSFFNINLIPLWVSERYRGSGIFRRAVLSYGYAQWLLYFSIIFLTIKVPFRYKQLVYLLGFLVLLAEMLTLTRRVYISILAMVIFIVLIVDRIKGRQIRFSTYFKAALVFTFLVFVILSIFPGLFQNIKLALRDVFLLSTTGVNTQGSTDIRITFDIPQHIARFRSSPIIGYGYDMTWYSNNPEKGGISANDSPLTAAIGMFGLLGVTIFAWYYFFLIRTSKNVFLQLKSFLHTGGFRNYPFIFILLIMFIAIIFKKFTVSLMGLFSELITGTGRAGEALTLGFVLAGLEIVSVLNSNAILGETDKNG